VAIREVPSGTTPFEIANAISSRLAAAVIAARIAPGVPAAAQNSASEGQSDGEPASEASMYATEDAVAVRLVDLSAPLTADMRLELVKENDPDALKILRHSSAHVMATAVL